MSSPRVNSWTPRSDDREGGGSGRKSWGEGGGERNWAAEDPHRVRMSVGSKVMSPKGVGSPNRHGRHRSQKSPSSDQLAPIKNQWNMERDIPTGTVRNNPFVPKPSPTNAPPPQLMHQKRQWDTSGIPRGSVAAKAMSIFEGEQIDEGTKGPPLRISTQGGHSYDRRSQGVLSPPNSSMSPSRFEPERKTHTSRGAYPTESEVPANDTSRRGRLIENPSVSQSPASEHQPRSNKWQPSREVPTGTVKGQMDKFLPDNSHQGTRRKVFNSRRGGDDQSEEDPWIIPSKVAASHQVFDGDWGEAVAAKSSGSDDWDTPASDWLNPSESQTTMSEDKSDRFHTRNTASRHHVKSHGQPATYEAPQRRRDQNLGIIEEKKMNEDDRDADVLNMARQKKKQQDAITVDDDPFGTTHLRDAEILQAAKQKVERSATEKKERESFDSSFQRQQNNPEAFEGDVFADAKSSFQSPPELDFAFPTSPFGDHDRFQAFDSFNKVETGRDMVDPATLASTPSIGAAAETRFHEGTRSQPIDLQNEVMEVNTSRNSKSHLEDSEGLVIQDAGDAAPKKQRKGFFNKIFGGGRKNGGSGRKSNGKRPEKSGRREKSSPSGSERNLGFSPSTQGPKQSWVDMPVADINATSTSQAEPNSKGGNLPLKNLPDNAGRPSAGRGEQKIVTKKSEDDTTVSEMTLPTVFKNKSKTTSHAEKDLSSPSLATFVSREQTGSPVTMKRDLDSRNNPRGSGMIESPVIDLVGNDDDGRVAREKRLPASSSEDSAYESYMSAAQPPPPPPPRLAIISDKEEISLLDQQHAQLDAMDGVDDPALDHVSLDDDSTGEDEVLGKEPTSLNQSKFRDSARFQRRVKHLKQTSTRNSFDSASLLQSKPKDATGGPRVERKTPKFVERHARTKNSKIGKPPVGTRGSAQGEKQATQEDRRSRPSLERNVANFQGKRDKRFADNRFAKASRAYQQGQQRGHHPHKITAKPLGTLENLAVAAGDSVATANSADGSIGSQRTQESSVASDIRVLRSILRRPRKAPLQEKSVQSKPVFASYDENNISDPMQRAGLRLLSAAIIPIQTEVRRFLAMRRALTKMWALIVIQTYSRRWIARKQFLREMDSIMTIQAACRGHQARNDLVYQHVCAIEIQRHVRGYISTMRVYEDIYKVTMVQSYVRMKLAMDEGTRRMALVIQLQAVARGFLTRRQLEYKEVCAVAIQANWRCFFTRLTYQFDLLDIIIVQSVWRRNMASRRTDSLRQKRNNRSAKIIQAQWRSYDCVTAYRRYRGARVIQTEWRSYSCAKAFSRNRSAKIIQTKWRSYDCTMNYLHYLADVLIVQSTIRRFLVLKQVRSLKEESAIKIQSAWRGFVCYADYMFSIADIVVVQKVARRWLASRAARELRYSKHSESAKVLQTFWVKFYYARKIQRVWRLRAFRLKREKATLTIQKSWRCFVDETEFVVMKYEYYAARTIQSYWRRFWCFSNFIIALDCSIQIQAAFRGFSQRQKFGTMKDSAVCIQSVSRGIIAKNEMRRLQCSQEIAIKSNATMNLESNAAITIQALVRGQQARTAVHSYKAARTIQSTWRSKRLSTAYQYYCAARRIQSAWRGRRLSTAYSYYCAARQLQALWRGKRLQTAYKFYNAALAIQTQSRAQKARRDVLVLRGEFLAAALIQSAWRGFVCYTDYIFTVSDIISAQKTARKYLARKRYAGQIRDSLLQRRAEDSASVVIQKASRGFISRQRYWYILGCTMQIQSWIRGRICFWSYQRQASARLTLQCFARRCQGRQEYLQRRFILMLIQTADKERTKRVAAMVIQDQYRTFLDSKTTDSAARVIQRFFLMVKFEVDRMVKATKRRKNWRKKMKHRNDEVEDALLEDAWTSTVRRDCNTLKGGQSSFTLGGPSSSHDSGINENQRSNSFRGSHSKPIPSKSKKNVVKPARRPPLGGHSDKLSTIVRLHHEDDQTEFSGLTDLTGNFMRQQPISRMKELGSREMDEDLELEEAFIDAQILTAKERNNHHGPSTTGRQKARTTRVNVMLSKPYM